MERKLSYRACPAVPAFALPLVPHLHYVVASIKTLSLPCPVRPNKFWPDGTGSKAGAKKRTTMDLCRRPHSAPRPPGPLPDWPSRAQSTAVRPSSNRRTRSINAALIARMTRISTVMPLKGVVAAHARPTHHGDPPATATRGVNAIVGIINVLRSRCRPRLVTAPHSGPDHATLDLSPNAEP